MASAGPQIDLSFLRDRAALKRIAAVTVACAAAGVVYGLVAPKWYRSMLTVVPVKSQRSGSGLAALLGSDAAGLAAGLIESGGAMGADAQRIAAVLQSIAVSDAVIQRFDLKARYDEKYQELTREELWEHCAVKVLPKPSLVQLSCEDRDPVFAQQMLSYFAEYGNQVFRRVGVSSATEESRFLEKRVAELRQQADETAARMREFQEKHKIVDLDTQAKAVVSSLAALNSQKISKQLELDYARTFSAREEPSLRQLESQLMVMGNKLKSLEEPVQVEGAGDQAGKGGMGAKGGMFPAALDVPRLRAEFEKLYRDRRVAEATLVFALERLEGAKASEARDVSTFVVLDPPPIPTRKSRPRRSVIVLLFTAVGLVAGGVWEAWRAGSIAAFAKSLGAGRAGRSSG